jgi:sugar lactone lactonase YvrE
MLRMAAIFQPSASFAITNVDHKRRSPPRRGVAGAPADAKQGSTGFTNIIDIALAKDGSLYLLEIAANGLRSNDPSGALTRVLPDGTKQTIVAPGEGLFMPGGVAIGPDGALYVTNWSVLPGGGTVVRIVP